MNDFQPNADYDLDLHDDEDAPSETAVRIGAVLDAQLDGQQEVPEDNVHELPLAFQIHTPSLTNSPGCTPIPATASKRMRTVRVDAWAVPASANWTRTRRTARKVSKSEKKADWALPF